MKIKQVVYSFIRDFRTEREPLFEKKTKSRSTDAIDQQFVEKRRLRIHTWLRWNSVRYSVIFYDKIFIRTHAHDVIQLVEMFRAIQYESKLRTRLLAR